MDDARIGPADAAYRGFLFSDLRDFTGFVERHGNAAAAALVASFLEIARAAIARHEGAEVKTEGDSIHAVFPAASSAVLCGLEIVDAVAEVSGREPQRPMRVGVGVHAGEAVATPTGYIGTAVNLAARVCSVARPGEVLVTSTVRGITRASIPVGFIARGRRRLKGIAEPVEVFAVTRDMTAQAPRVTPRRLVIGVAGVIVIGLVALVASWGLQLLAGTSSGSASSPQPLEMGPLPIGTYSSREFQPAVKFHVLDQGWTANRDTQQVLGLIRDEATQASLSLLRVSEVLTDPCVSDGEASRSSLAAGDLIAALHDVPHLSLADAQEARVGGFAAQQVDITVADGALAACGGLAGGEVAVFGAGAEVWRATPGEIFRVISADVGDQAVTVAMGSEWGQVRSVQELENLFDLAQRVVDTVEFE